MKLELGNEFSCNLNKIVEHISIESFLNDLVIVCFSNLGNGFLQFVNVIVSKFSMRLLLLISREEKIEEWKKSEEYFSISMFVGSNVSDISTQLIFPCCCCCYCSWYVIVEKKCWIGGERSGEFLMEIEYADPCMETVTTIIRLRQMESKADTRNGVCTPGDKNICTRCTSTWRALDASWKYLPCCTTYMGNRISVITFTINIEFYRPFLFFSLSLLLRSFPFPLPICPIDRLNGQSCLLYSGSSR